MYSDFSWIVMTLTRAPGVQIPGGRAVFPEDALSFLRISTVEQYLGFGASHRSALSLVSTDSVANLRTVAMDRRAVGADALSSATRTSSLKPCLSLTLF
jgi:hypothetical protein